MKNLVIMLVILLGSLLASRPVNSMRRSMASQTTIDPKILIQKSADACQQIRTIQYTEEQFSTQGEKLPDLMATIRQTRADVPSSGFLPGKFIVEGKFNKRDTNPEQFAYSYDGASLRILDPTERTVRVVKSPTPRVMGSLLAPFGLIGIPQFTQDQPFKSLLDRGESFVYEGTRTIDGVACHVITISQVIDHPSLGKQTSTARWFIGLKDYLPRGYEIGDNKKLIHILIINAASVTTEYTLSAPAGYGEKLITGNEPRSRGLLGTGSIAPDWTLSDSQGRTHSLKDYRGKVVLIDFWGTWCVPCRRTMPTVQALHEKYKDRGVAVFGIAVADDEGDPVGYMKRNGFTYNLLLKGDRTAGLYRAEVLPTLYIIGRDGRIVHSEYGFRENAKDELTSVIEQILKAEVKQTR